MKRKSKKELRKFGITMAIALGIIGCLVLWRSKPAWPYLLGISGVFLIFGLILPRALRPIEWGWMKLAYILGIIVSHILVTLTFFLVITPMGCIIRLIGKDLLNLKFDKKAESYWIPVDPDGPCSRPEKPF